ncbi:hypothetical protein NL676_023377 [Syzygium grande]|nr:hypothetical protein NL676_023377 [Syzygium grande]
MSLPRRGPAALLAVLLAALCIPPSLSQNDTTGAASCPLNFTVLSDLFTPASRPSLGVSTECGYILQSLRLVQSRYLQLTGSFLPPLSSSNSCWVSYQGLIDTFIPNFDIRRYCGFETSWISEGCMNITTLSQFEALIPNSTLSSVSKSCNQSLENSSPCGICTVSLSSIASYLNGPSVGNVSDCTAYPFIYAAAFANYLGPTDKGTAKCLFNLDFTDSGGKSRMKLVVILVVLIGCGLGLVAALIGFWLYRRKHGRLKRRRGGIDGVDRGFGLQNFEESTTVVRFSFEDIKRATRNFSRDYIIGRGGYGNVYRGLLQDGTEVALKRFKNCSAAGDANFAHEVEVIASVRHVNLVALRGYCIATTQYEGHQRIIVCDLMRNGSLHDHLFGSAERKLSWPIRQKVALGTARGPTMDQVVKMLETELSVPSIPERPIPLVADMDDIERSFSSIGSGRLSTPRGFQSYTLESDTPRGFQSDTLESECASDNKGTSSSTSK